MAYAAPVEAFEALMERLALDAIDFDGPAERFGERVITLRDPDWLAVEVVATGEAAGASLDGFHGVTLWLADPEPTARLLVDHSGYAAAREEAEGGVTRLRLVAPGARAARCST